MAVSCFATRKSVNISKWKSKPEGLKSIYYGIYGIVRKTGWALCSLILAGVFSTFGYSADNSLGIRVIWLVCALLCLIGLILFTPYKLGDTKDETKNIMRL